MPNKKISEYSAITTLVGADLFEVSQHVSGSTYTSKKISVTDMLTVFAGVTDHGALTGLGDNDHPQYLLVSAVNDTIEAAIANAPTGTGSVVLSNTPTLTTPNIGAATGTSLVLTHTATQLTLGNGATTCTFTQSSGGDLTIAPSGGDTSITGTLAVSSTATVHSLVVRNAGNGVKLSDDGTNIQILRASDDAALASIQTNFGLVSPYFKSLQIRAVTNNIGIMADKVVFTPLATDAELGAATSRTCMNKAVASIADNTATTVFTVTIPNGAHSASIRVRLIGSSGAGGAIGANESTQEAEYLINLCRTAGVNAVAAIGAVIGQPAAVTVAGGNAVAVSATLGAISGAVGASNTFTIQVTIARAGSTADNHTCLAFAELLNANATGVTIA